MTSYEVAICALALAILLIGISVVSLWFRVAQLLRELRAEHLLHLRQHHDVRILGASPEDVAAGREKHWRGGKWQ